MYYGLLGNATSFQQRLNLHPYVCYPPVDNGSPERSAVNGLQPLPFGAVLCAREAARDGTNSLL